MSLPRLMLTAGLVLGLSGGGAFAQPATSSHAVAPPSGQSGRNPTLGDPGTKNVGKPSRAAAEARADKQPPGTENGNQPDRAAAGGGAR